MDELRYFLLCQNRKQKNKLLPPTSDNNTLMFVNSRTFATGHVWDHMTNHMTYLATYKWSRYIYLMNIAEVADFVDFHQEIPKIAFECLALFPWWAVHWAGKYPLISQFNFTNYLALIRRFFWVKLNEASNIFCGDGWMKFTFFSSCSLTIVSTNFVSTEVFFII